MNLEEFGRTFGIKGETSNTKLTKGHKTSEPLPPKVIIVKGWSEHVVKEIEEKLIQGYVLHGDMMHNKGTRSDDFALCQVMVEKEFYYKHFVKNRGDIL